MQEASAKSTGKAARKAIPGNFVEIIDTLVDKLASYKGVILSKVSKSEDAAREGAAEGSSADTQMESTPLASQPPAASSGLQVDAKPAQDAAKDKQVLRFDLRHSVRIEIHTISSHLCEPCHCADGSKLQIRHPLKRRREQGQHWCFGSGDCNGFYSGFARP